MSGLVSVIVLNWNGLDDTVRCIQDLEKVVDPGGGVETIVVDNGSTDNTPAHLAAHHSEVRVIANSRNLGFAQGCNIGAHHARGEYLAFLNNDARPDPKWLAEAVSVLETSADTAAVASRVLSWDGTSTDFDGDAGVTWYGFGYRTNFGEPLPAPSPDQLDPTPREVLFGTGSALVVRASVFHEVGGFDERFFAFFEDVDLGWRLWLLGHRVLYVPTSVVFHRHHGTMGRQAEWREDYLLARNALFSLVKNLDDEHLARALPAAMLLTIRRGFVVSGEDSRALDLERGNDDDAPTQAVTKRALASAFALDQLAGMLPELLETRADIQEHRVRTDDEIFRLVRTPMLISHPDPGMLLLHRALDDLFDLDAQFTKRRRIAVVTGDPLGRRLSGPGIRALELARLLAREHDVRLASTTAADLQVDGIDVVDAVTDRQVKTLERWADVIVFQGFLLHEHPWLARSRKVIVVDLYDPFHLEQLEQSRSTELDSRVRAVDSTIRVLNAQVARGDFFMCASDKQRDLWLGHLGAVGRLNPYTYDNDESMSSLIDVVPFGLPDDPPTRTGPAIRGVIDGIGPDDKVILWGGGLYPWFDPATLVRAVARVAESVPDVRLVFLAGRHPNPGVPPMPVVEQTRALAKELGLLDRHVFFVEHWVDYQKRHDYLLDADIGVSTHLDHVETNFSFRTRILDYLWARLPVVCTGGDAMGELVEREQIGLVVPPADAVALADALERLLKDDEFRAACRVRLDAVAPRFTWGEVAQPLVEFCRRPRRAADLRIELGDPVPGRTTEAARTVVGRARLAAGAVSTSVARDGWRATASKVATRLPGRLPGTRRGRR